MADIAETGLADAGTLAELRSRSQGRELDAEFGERMNAWLVATASVRTTWLAREGDRPVGMVSVSRYDRMPRPGEAASAWGYLGQLYVVDEHRGVGLGRRLVDTVVAHAALKGWARLVLAPTERAKPLYARAGFEPAGDRLVVIGGFGSGGSGSGGLGG